MTLSRRAMFGGLVGLAAPAIIRTPGLLMAIRPERTIRVTLEMAPTPTMEWLREQVEAAMLAAISKSGPIRYNDNGYRILLEAAQSVEMPTIPYIITFRRS